MTRILYALAFLVAMSIGMPCFAQGANFDWNGQNVTGLQGYPGASTAPLSGEVWMYNSPINRYVPVYPGGPFYTIAGLPACNATTAGQHAIVSNGATSPSYGATVSATGAVTVGVFCNGTNWVYN